MKCPHCGKETERAGPDAEHLHYLHEAYPARAGGQRWPDAEKKFVALVRNGVDVVDILAKVMAYRQYCDATNRTGTQYVMQAATWLGRGGGWMEPWERLTLTEPALRFDQARRQLQEQT